MLGDFERVSASNMAMSIFENAGDSSGVSDSLAYECQSPSASRHTPMPQFMVAVHHPDSWHTQSPNKTPEPTAIGTFSFFIKVRVRRVAVTRWLSFFH